MKALFSPSSETFAHIGYDPLASVWRASTWMFLAALVGWLIGAPLALLFNPAQIEPLRELIGDSGDGLIAAVGLMLCVVPLGAFFSVIGAMISAGLYQLIAGLLGGRGNFTAMFMAFSAFGAPLGLVSAITSSVPVVQLCVSLPLGLYALVLSVIAVNGVNRFGYGKAILTILLPTLVLGLCCCLASFALGASLGPVMGEDFLRMLTPVP